jgi:hypothetical protein
MLIVNYGFFYNEKILPVIALKWQPATRNQREPHDPHDVAAQDEQLADDVLPTFPPNIDINFSVFFDLHAGQDTARLSLLDLNNISKTLLHFLHLNS